MSKRKIKIQNENEIYFSVDITLNVLTIIIKTIGIEGKILMEEKFYITENIDEDSHEKYVNILKSELEVPMLIYDIYIKYLNLKKLENDVFSQFENAKVLEFKEFQEGEDDYII